MTGNCHVRFLGGKAVVTPLTQPIINFIKNLTEGTIHAYGTTLSRGRTIVIIRVQIKSEDGRLLADGTVDMFCVK